MAVHNSQALDLLDVFRSYMSYKTSVWMPYFELCDKYYAGFYKPRVWPGTKVARSSIKLHVTSDLIETLYSSLLFTLFYSGGENFFDVLGSDPKKARMVTERLRFILNTPIDASGRTSFWAFKRALRSILKYGIGFVSIDYNSDIGRPTMAPASQYDLYWSSTAREWIDDSPYVFLFTRVPLMALEGFRALPGYKLPPLKVLKEHADNNIFTLDPMFRAKQEAAQKMIGQDVGRQGDDHSAKFMDLIRVTTKERIRWMLPMVRDEKKDSDATVIFDAPNRLQFQPYVAATYRPLLGNLGGASPVGLLAPEHDLQQSITNSMLDAINLALTPPRSKGPGSEKKREWKPGGFTESTTEKLEKPIELPTFPREAFDTYVESRIRSMRTIGTNEMAVSGRPTPSNANRTLGGVQAQSAAREERQFGPVEEIESSLITPGLIKLVLIDAHHTSSVGMVEGRGPKFEQTEVEANAIDGQVHIEVRGATRMIGVQRLSSALKVLLDYLFSSQIQSEAAKSGKQLDFDEVNQLVNDALGLDRKYKFWRDMTQQEQQSRQQAATMGDQAKLAAQQQVQAGHDQVKETVERMKQEGLDENRAKEIIIAFMQSLQQGAPQPTGEGATT